MELGPLQLAWVKELRKHPERQSSRTLGHINEDGSMKLCCLGQGLVCLILSKNEPLPIGTLKDVKADGIDTVYTLHNSYKELGLRSSGGILIDRRLSGYSSLANANDGGVSWLKIADFIEQYPEVVFTHSV